MKKVLAAFFALALIFLTGCEPQAKTFVTEQKKTEENQKTLLANQPPPKLDWSLERDNIYKRTMLWNDPAKVSYIYLTSYGKVMAFYTIKGKVSSVNSYMTNFEQVLDGCYYDSASSHDPCYDDVVIEAPSEDGSYGTNGEAVFFFTTDGTYVEWSGEYMLADQPLKLSTPPELVREIK